MDDQLIALQRAYRENSSVENLRALRLYELRIKRITIFDIMYEDWFKVSELNDKVVMTGQSKARSPVLKGSMEALRWEGLKKRPNKRRSNRSYRAFVRRQCHEMKISEDYDRTLDPMPSHIFGVKIRICVCCL